MARQSDLDAFLGRSKDTNKGKSKSKQKDKDQPTRRTTRSASASSTSHPPPSKRVKRESPAEQQPLFSADEGEDGDEDVKPDVKPKIEDGEANGGGRKKHDRRLTEEETGTLPPEMSSVPLAHLYDALRDLSTVEEGEVPKEGVVVWWMRNKDLRLVDNTALSHASALAQSLSLPLLALHIFSPGDYKSHDRSPRRIDFQLRQLQYLQGELAKKDIPLFTFSHDKRKEIPRVLCDKLAEWNAAGCFANIEYEVDELRRDVEVLKRTKAARESGEGFKGKVELFRDFCIIAPGEVLTKQGKPYSVYSPFQRAWADKINSNLMDYMVDQNPPLQANDSSARSHPVLSSMFDHEIPTSIPGFELADEAEAERMRQIWPVGEGVTDEILRRFLHTKVKAAMFDRAPLDPGAEDVEDPENQSRAGVYQEGRNRVDWDGTSHISAYLAAGLVSPRDCIRAAYQASKSKTMPSGRDSGIGFWTMEIAWRDFYQHVLAAWPRVCMSLPYNLKYNDTIEWAEDEEDVERKFKAWTEGRTGVPIVDAAMRSLNTQGYMHNRCRMIVASYLTKDLLIDWRRGEKYFMQQLVDGDLGQNNGGWQWAASTGCDPQPFFRIFNPVSQAEKVDPDGKYIKHWVPELRSLKGKAIHNPSAALSPAQLRDMGYLAPIVDHAKARTKAIEVYKRAAQNGA